MDCTRGFLILLLSLLLLPACRMQKEVVEQSEKVHTVVQKVQAVDIQYRDRWHTLVQRGDTIYQHDSIVEYLDRVVHDTVYVADSTGYQHQELERPVVAHEREPLTKVQRFFLRSGIALWCILLLLLAGWIIKKFVL